LDNTADARQKTQATRRYYKPISPEAWGRLITYLEQAEGQLRDPTAPEPDINLLADAKHGPFVDIRLGHNSDGRLGLFFQARLGATQPRHAPPLVTLMWRLHLAFGGGGHFNDNGTGWSGVRIGSVNCKPMLLRLVQNAKLGELVRQKRGPNFRSQDPGNFVKVPIEAVWSEGKPTRVPYAGRPEMTAYSLDRFRRSHKQSGIAVTEAGYEAILRRVYALIDATLNAEDLDA